MKTLAQIAAELQSYDPEALPADDVKRLLSKLVTAIQAASDVVMFDGII